MTTRVNLNDNVEASYPFSIGGVDFDLKYPTLEELEPISNLNSEREEAIKADNKEEVAEIDKKLETAFYSFIRPVDGVSDIREVLKKQPFPVVKAFNKMVSDQLQA